jgi:hypothetical protein
MTSRIEKPDSTGARRGLSPPDVSMALCAAAMLLATLLSEPFAAAGNAALAADTSAAGGSAGKPQATKAIDQDASDTVERTVFRPELFVPVTGNLSVTIEQQ